MVRLTANILFSGIGCQERGIRDTGLFDLDVIATSEIDTDAVISYAAVHCGMTQEMADAYEYPPLEDMRRFLTHINLGYSPETDKRYNWFRNGKKNEDRVKKAWLACKLSNNLGDIRGIKRLDYADLWTLSSPCQSISLAGKLRGLDPDDNTRSSLLWQNIRLLKEAVDEGIPPKYIFMENVKNLVGKRFIGDFEAFCGLMDDLGYNTYWAVINARDCGVPQNRERVFALFIRKDIDTGNLVFPKPFDNGLRLKDVLEEHVDEKYYLKADKAQKLIDQLICDGVIGNENTQKDS